MKQQRQIFPFYKELIDTFSGHIIPRSQTKLTGISDSQEILKIRQEVVNAIKKNKMALDEIQNAILKFEQSLVLFQPQIYVARTKDIKTEIEYFTAKTFWPLPDGKKKEVKIYLGKAEEFNNDTKSKKAKDIAVVKMRQTIARRMREGTL